MDVRKFAAPAAFDLFALAADVSGFTDPFVAMGLFVFGTALLFVTLTTGTAIRLPWTWLPR
jgi:hypothetical protein